MLMALDADPGVEAVASQPMWLHWVSESGQGQAPCPGFLRPPRRRHRRADRRPALITWIGAADSAVFAATAVIAGQAGWAYDRVGELPAVRAANLRWLAGYRHPRYARAAVMAALGEVFAEPGPLRAGAAGVGDPLAVLPVLFAMLWRGGLSADLDSRVLGPATVVRIPGALMTRHPVAEVGRASRRRCCVPATCCGWAARHTVAGLDSATVRLADVTGAVMEVPTAGLLADPSLELVTASRVPLAPQPALERLPAETVESCALVGAAPDRGDHRGAAGQPAGHPAPPGIRPGPPVAAAAGAGQA